MYNTDDPTAECGSMEIRRPSLIESTNQRLTKAREEVKRLEELLVLLQANPEVNRIMELLGGKY